MIKRVWNTVLIAQLDTDVMVLVLWNLKSVPQEDTVIILAVLSVLVASPVISAKKAL